MAKKPSQIEFLPPNWYWVAAGKEEWVTSEGKKSTAKHAINLLTGKTMSVRQVQNIQRDVRDKQGELRPPTFHRPGKTRTQFLSTKHHGYSANYIFRNFADAEAFVRGGNIPEGYTVMAIQVKFKKSAIPGKEYPARRGDGWKSYANYATLTKFEHIDEAIMYNTIWEQAEKKLEEFILDDRSRIYIYVGEY